MQKFSHREGTLQYADLLTGSFACTNSEEARPMKRCCSQSIRLEDISQLIDVKAEGDRELMTGKRTTSGTGRPGIRPFRDPS